MGQRPGHRDGMRPVSDVWLIASDLDGTLIPPDDNEARRAEIGAFAREVADRDDLVLAYVTGRHFDFAVEGIRRWSLPDPDLLVCDVGTTLYRGTEPDSADAAYREAMREALGGTTADRLRALLASEEGVELQEEEKQGEFKASAYLPSGEEGRAIGERVAERLREEGIRARSVASVDPLDGRGLLDLLPAGVSKAFAVRWLHDHAGVREERLVYAGDSGNDRDAMLAGYHVIVVANAPAALERELRREATGEQLERIYFARARYVAGVIEGLRHWRVL